ncbi:MAG: AAA family ATPase, partial [Gammaproteobacteria bacterium]
MASEVVPLLRQDSKRQAATQKVIGLLLRDPGRIVEADRQIDARAFTDRGMRAVYVAIREAVAAGKEAGPASLDVPGYSVTDLAHMALQVTTGEETFFSHYVTILADCQRNQQIAEMFEHSSAKIERGESAADVGAVFAENYALLARRADKSSGFLIRSVDDLLSSLGPANWLIKNYFELDSLALMFGDPGAGKSFVAMDLALHVATGTPWHGNKTQKRSVIYAAGEGHHGLASRARAGADYHRIDITGAPLYFSLRAAAFYDEESAADVSEAINRLSKQNGVHPGLVVIDTLARNFGPGNENSTDDMNKFIAHLDLFIRQRFGATVLIVHHTGHSDKNRARGATALKAALDSEYKISRDENNIVRLDCTKMKDAVIPDSLAFAMKVVELPMSDEDGNVLTSVALQKIDWTPRDEKPDALRGKNLQL